MTNISKTESLFAVADGRQATRDAPVKVQANQLARKAEGVKAVSTAWRKKKKDLKLGKRVITTYRKGNFYQLSLLAFLHLSLL